ncbi:MAG: hypothetical protein KGJ08_04560 [Gammaproteobacteria bacterium]|nr:hypothetical protein [Gammaproteobacteria bacterium]
MTWGNPARINWNIPDDARIVQQDDNWTIYHSTANVRLYIYPACYHVQALPLSAKALLRLLQVLMSSPDRPYEDGTVILAEGKNPYFGDETFP